MGGAKTDLSGLTDEEVRTLFLIAGMGQAVYRMARERKICPQPLPLGRAAWLSACTAVVLILLVWLILRADHL